MSYPSPLGPSQADGQIGADSLLWPDAANVELKKANQPEIYYYLPKFPRLVRDSRERPVFALTLVLDRRPTPQDETISPLIQQGMVNFEITFAPAAAAPEDTAAIVYRSLFTREVGFKLICDHLPSAITLATATANSPPAQAAISATLNRDETLALLSTLDGTATSLKLDSQITYRVASTEQTLRLSGAWVAVYDFLKPRLSAAGTFSVAELYEYFAQMLEEQVLSVFASVTKSQEERVAKPDAALLFNRFLRLAAIVLRCESLELENDHPQNRYSLRGRPHPMFHLDYKQTYTNVGQTTLALTTGLAEILGGALDGLDRSLFIHLVAPSPTSAANSEGGLTTIPRRLHTSSGQRRNNSMRNPVELAAISGTIQSIPLALQPSATAMFKPQVLAASAAIQVQNQDLAMGGRVKQWWLDDMIVDRPKVPIVKSLPVIQDPNAATWSDRLDATRYWYAPSFAVVSPSPTADPETAKGQQGRT
jgi:hypothetical protein